MNKLLIAAALAGAFAAGGVTQVSAANSDAYCDTKAQQAVYAREHPILKAGIACGVGGFIANAITGGNGAATAAGCAGSAAVVTLLGADERAAVYNDAFAKCKGGKSYVQPVNSCPVETPPSGVDGGYVVGSDDWQTQCSLKYKSYNKPGPWEYNGFDGCVHYCDLPD